jgi:hypothetical protein
MRAFQRVFNGLILGSATAAIGIGESDVLVRIPRSRLFVSLGRASLQRARSGCMLYETTIASKKNETTIASEMAETIISAPSKKELTIHSLRPGFKILDPDVLKKRKKVLGSGYDKTMQCRCFKISPSIAVKYGAKVNFIEAQNMLFIE